MDLKLSLPNPSLHLGIHGPLYRLFYLIDEYDIAGHLA